MEKNTGFMVEIYLQKECEVTLEWVREPKTNVGLKPKVKAKFEDNFFETLCSYKDINRRASFFVVINVLKDLQHLRRRLCVTG